MKFSLSKNIFLNIYYFLFSFFLIYLLIQKTRLGYFKESYQITEFLINYQGGFVRRGLLGEIILILYNTFGLDPYKVIIFLSLISFVVLVWFFIQNLIKKKHPLFFLPFVFFLGNPIIHDFWVRKDILLILFFILTIYYLKRRSSTGIIVANIILITGILIHESIAFFSFPLLFLILLSNQNIIQKRSLLPKYFIHPVILLSPSLIAFLFVIYFKGSLSISQKIWDSWSSISFPYFSVGNQEIPAAIQGLSWSLKEGLLYSYHTLSNFNDGIYAPIGWTLIIIIIYYVLTNTEKVSIRLFGYKSDNNLDKQNISNLLIIQFCSVIPLFILGWDYSRWIFFWVTSSFAVYILVPHNELSKVFPQIISDITGKINNTLNLFFNGSNILLLSVLIGFSAHSWSLISTINSSSVIIVLKFISKVLEQIFLLIKEVIF